METPNRRELLFQPVQWLLGSDPLMGRVDPAAPAGALHAEQIAEWDPDLHPAIVDLKPMSAENQRREHWRMAFCRCSMDTGFKRNPVGWKE